MVRQIRRRKWWAIATSTFSSVPCPATSAPKTRAPCHSHSRRMRRRLNNLEEAARLIFRVIGSPAFFAQRVGRDQNQGEVFFSEKRSFSIVVNACQSSAR